MGFDRKYLVWALCYAVAGMGLGIGMAASRNFSQMSTHSHVLLAGFVVSFVYAVVHRLWLGEKPPSLSRFQFIVHQAGTITLSAGLFLAAGQIFPEKLMEPILGLASVAVLAGAVLMLFMLLKAQTPPAGG